MTKKELLEKLKDYSDDQEVIVCSWDDFDSSKDILKVTEAHDGKDEYGRYIAPIDEDTDFSLFFASDQREYLSKHGKDMPHEEILKLIEKEAKKVLVIWI